MHQEVVGISIVIGDFVALGNSVLNYYTASIKLVASIQVLYHCLCNITTVQQNNDVTAFDRFDKAICKPRHWNLAIGIGI